MKNIIAGYRTMLGKTQKDMADELGISRQAYYMKENGKTPFSDSEKIIIKKLIASVNPNATIDEIFFTTDTKNYKEI